ncbi:Dual specificity protein phosphatase 12 [Camellia lanceoleosa]|uniref:Dual specificity protein phosphatase 12 n=1 Tax=Camellia lanceoleosa TaxID=1840588 RepID=A0ACC0G6J5_9ERIC|nr:Dual specificity protein phosphatase 12 [Camellia lanceoleosa]
MPHLVREHLFIGNISDAAEVLQNGSKEITHILSILSSASISFFSEWRSGLSIPTEEICKVYAGDSELEVVLGDSSKSSLSPEKLLYSLEYAGNDLKLVRMAVPLRDTENENLLEYLDVCLDVIDKSRKEGSMLVHCFASVSRSAAIITAYLMRTEQLSKEDALESLQKSCEFVCPNDNIFFFPLQLKMFEEMGFKVDHACPIYKHFRLKMLCPMMTGDSYKRGERIDTSKFGADPGLPTEEAFSDVGTSGNSGRVSTAAYRCKKYWRVVALQENIVDHVPGEGETSFGWHKRKGGNPFNKCDEIECSSIFVEPLHWMTTGQAFMCTLKLAWVTSTGQASNAVVVAGSPQPFSSIKAELTLALSDIFQHRRDLYASALWIHFCHPGSLYSYKASLAVAEH